MKAEPLEGDSEWSDASELLPLEGRRGSNETGWEVRSYTACILIILAKAPDASLGLLR